MLDGVDLWVRILLAAGLGAGLGIERELSNQPAGLRTHILVSLGAALFTIAGAYGAASFLGDPAVRSDPTRIAAQVVTGIGFLGAGAIIQQGVNVRGLTTAASLWVTAAVGLAAGLGYYEAAIATAAVTVVALVALKPIERGILAKLSVRRHRLIVEPDNSFSVRRLVEHLEEIGVAVGSFSLQRKDAESHYFILSIRLPRILSKEIVIRETSALEGVRGAAWYG